MPVSQIVCAKGRASGLSGPCRLVSFLSWKPWAAPLLPKDTALSWWGRGPRGAPSGCSAQTALVLLCEPGEPVAEADGPGWWRWGPGIPSLAPSQHQRREDVG